MTCCSFMSCVFCRMILVFLHDKSHALVSWWDCDKQTREKFRSGECLSAVDGSNLANRFNQFRALLCPFSPLQYQRISRILPWKTWRFDFGNWVTLYNLEGHGFSSLWSTWQIIALRSCIPRILLCRVDKLGMIWSYPNEEFLVYCYFGTDILGTWFHFGIRFIIISPTSSNILRSPARWRSLPRVIPVMCRSWLPDVPCLPRG